MMYFCASLYALSLLSQDANNFGMNWSASFKLLGQFFFLIIVFVVVLFAAFYVTKLVSSIKYTKSLNSNMMVIESLSVGANCMLFLVKAGDKFFVIGVSKDRICFLTDVNGNSIELPNLENKVIDFSFDQQLKKMMNKLLKNKNDSDSGSE